MSARTLLYLLLLALATFLAVRFDVPTKVKIGATNLIYGDEMRGFKGFRLDVELLNPELEKKGLTREGLLQELTARLEKAGVKKLAEEEWQKTPGKPALSLIVNATKGEDGRYQYAVTIEVTKSEPRGLGAGSEEVNTLWITSNMGEGNVADIRAAINRETGFFLRAHEK
jgi:hypothetical protein